MKRTLFAMLGAVAMLAGAGCSCGGLFPVHQNSGNASAGVDGSNGLQCARGQCAGGDCGNGQCGDGQCGDGQCYGGQCGGGQCCGGGCGDGACGDGDGGHFHGDLPRGVGGCDLGAAGPATGAVAYPYYTCRGPRDFFANNPPSIGP